ncbi:MAG: TAT-variant-translocated molybdopterin oxidoreductase [Chitinophagales bacterium]|nr:TAT-variant-translocated molybdopterin oxidoreductase [Chitinophagales bacterium]MDW8418180.1 TAT-variant-translocated molybdopterin oxidoreductase [Chitinophagales bacterium]
MKAYWKGIEEKEQLEGFTASADKEFSEELPALHSITEPIINGKSSRKDFLKMLGYSTTAAVIAASCEMPVRKSIPYVWRPEEITPGIPNFYATTMWQGGEYNAVLVKTREGRPIKIEGKKDARISKGGTSARAQASVLSLYDGARYKNPLRNSGSSKPENITWEKADKEIGDKLSSISGKIVLFSSTIISPSLLSLINIYGSKLGGKFEHLIYDAISYSGILDANQKSFGKRSIPSYNFGAAKVIVGIGADFLGTWLSPVEFSADYATTRKVKGSKSTMSRHIQIESVPTITGFKADTRIVVKPSDELNAVVDLYNVIVAGGSAKNPKIAKVAEELSAAAGNSLVVCGSNDVNVQLLVNAINAKLGNYGNTISWSRTINTKQGSDESITKLVNGINDGSIGAVLIYDANPVYNAPIPGVADALKKVFTVSFANRVDETSMICNYVLPDNHWLESWGDAEAKSGILNTIQPTISKLFDTRPFAETLMKWSGINGTYYDYLQNYWQTNYYSKQNTYNSFWAFWDNVVHDGEFEFPASGTASYNPAGETDALGAVSAYASSLGELQVKFYETVAIGDGYWADNPFLQELPDPVSKVTWDNYIIVSPKFYNDNGYNIDPHFKEKRHAVAKLTVNGKTVELPVVAVPGTAENTLGVALGYGRSATEYNELKVGKNVYPMLSFTGKNYTNIAKASLIKTEDTAQLAITQTHFNITLKDLGGIKTRKIVKETTLPEYIESELQGKKFCAGNEDREHIMEELVTLYYEHDKPGHHWTMVIDLNSCTGCGACVVACNIENNIPVVGKDQVIRAREMHWLRIDRYFTGEMENPDVVLQPMLCQHCDNAPCENVCPVAATNHSSEGLNQMAYNRCIGTRYCANNCPYKVRRFNWYDYQAADAFDARWHTSNDWPLSEATLAQHEPLARMVLNPDVTVRSRGVMEKCSFCVQRLQVAKLEAKKEGRRLADGEATTACQTACATGCITFGDRNDKSSKVYEAFNDSRAFGVVEEIHTMPNVLYLTQVRNRSEKKKYERLDYFGQQV